MPVYAHFVFALPCLRNSCKLSGGLVNFYGSAANMGVPNSSYRLFGVSAGTSERWICVVLQTTGMKSKTSTYP